MIVCGSLRESTVSGDLPPSLLTNTFSSLHKIALDGTLSSEEGSTQNIYKCMSQLLNWTRSLGRGRELVN